ncbi:MAG TPA: general stress protein [Terracidiphilus sp.]
MAGKNTAAFAIFPNRAAAESAVDRLVADGFSNQDVSVLMSDTDNSREFATEKNTKAPEGTTTGVGVGGVVGGTLGLLAGLGALAIPGVGPLIAAGPIMGALAGLGVGGAVGGLVGALIGLGIPEYEAKRYEGRVKDGGILVSVHCDTSEEISRAKDVLKRAGGEDIASSGEKSVSSHTANSDTAYNDTRYNDRDRVVSERAVTDDELVSDRRIR